MGLSIYQRINAIQSEVSYIKKDAKVQGYKAVTHDQVTAHMRDACVKHGVLIIPTQEAPGESISAGNTAKGTIIIRYEAMYLIKFIDIDSGDSIAVSIQAHANDSSDKAPGKCLSYAVKSAMLKVFMLETGENEESRVEPERRSKEKINPDQVKWIKEEIKEKGIDMAAFMGFLKKNRCATIEDINVTFFETVQAMIKKRVDDA